ncbi:Spc98 family-domain-containing protein [Cokeromyces recurvatus]|uniref:Spc98 family-domain-containing protein n=1 Tax=Cokeromyces recurvatus TaxID=90255 RepID=UPI00221FBA64|nr:Spc98 family-domain-containing protein [Cokeromyces recurvatus]KAI7900324.1 Spc98 family-domain-containing protein [Cokeromyces recurvatus]
MSFMNEDELLGKLVHKITGLQFYSHSWKKAFEKAKYTIHYAKCTNTNETDVNDRYKGLVEKFSIKGHEEFSQALKQYKFKYLEDSRPIVVEEEINQTILKYDMLQLILSLSSSTNQNYKYIPALNDTFTKGTSLTWQDIIKEDPPQGDHWQTWPADSSTEDDDVSDDNESDSIHSELEKQQQQQQQQQQHRLNNKLENFQFNFLSSMKIDEREGREGIYYLKAEQYWNKKFNLPIQDSTSGSILQNSYQLSNELGKLLYNEEERQKLKTITEAGVIREILALLRGDSSVLFKYENERFKLEDIYLVQHLSRNALNNLLDEFCIFGNILLDLRKTIREIIKSKTYGQTSQAFAESIYKSLLDLNSFIATLEANSSFITKDTSQTISILKLRNTLDSSIYYFKTLHGILMNAPYEKNNALLLGSYFITVLYNFILISQSSGQLTLYNSLVNLLKDTLVPYGKWMDDWIFYGSLEGDRYKEFYVARKDNVNLYDFDFWKKGFEIKAVYQDNNRYTCPLFDPLFMDPVHLLSYIEKTSFLVSKGSIYSTFNNRVLEQLTKSTSSKQNISEPPSPTPFGSQQTTTITSILFPLLTKKDQENQIQSMINNGPLLFDQHFKYLLDTCYLEDPYINTADTLNNVLHEKCELKQQLKTLASVYLMLENDLMHSFCEALFLQIDNNELWLDPRLLNSTFINVCKANKYDEFAQITVKENNVNHSTLSSYLELIEFKVKIPWPLNNFIQIEHIPSYSKIQKFLFRLKRAKYVMEKKTLGRNKKIVYSDEKQFYSIRMKLLWFINVFWRYMMTTILHAETIHFRNELSLSKDADEIAAVHALYIRHIMDRCLLNDKTNVIKKSIIKVLDMAELMKDIFVEYMQTDNNKADKERFKASMNSIEYEFKRSNDFISRSLMIMGKKGGFPWFEHLASSLSIQ